MTRRPANDEMHLWHFCHSAVFAVLPILAKQGGGPFPVLNISMEAPVSPEDSQRVHSFRELYCEAHKCEPHMFERHLFVRTVWPHWRWLAPWFLRQWPAAFRRELRELAASGHATSLLDFKVVAGELRHDPREPHTFLRDTLGVRVSGRRLLIKAEAVWRSPKVRPLAVSPARRQRLVAAWRAIGETAGKRKEQDALLARILGR